MKPEIILTPTPWTQLVAGQDLVITWDASSATGFASIAVMLGTGRGDGDLGFVVAVDPTDSLTIPAGDLPTTGMVYLTVLLDLGDEGYSYDRVLRTVDWPPHTVVLAELADELAINSALATVDVADVRGLVGNGWQGFESWSRGVSSTDMVASGDNTAPNMWGRWRINYNGPPLVCFDGENATTDGWVEITILQERGSGYEFGKLALSVYRQALLDFQEASNGAWTFLAEAPSVINQDEQLGPVIAVAVAIPFRGL